MDMVKDKNRKYMWIDLSAGMDAAQYPVHCTDEAPDVRKDDCRTWQLWLRRVQAGTFTMGSPYKERGHQSDEHRHQVTLTRDYYIGVFPCTQRQWELVMGERPSAFSMDDCYATRPVECVSYMDIRGSFDWPAAGHAADEDTFMRRLRDKTGLLFDLPTEAQWEYACRRTPYGPVQAALSTGAELTSVIKCPEADAVARYSGNNDSESVLSGRLRILGTDQGTAKVGSYEPTDLGLYDMHGNVQEWCLDWYCQRPQDYGDHDPEGAYDGKFRVVRGGSWEYHAVACRAAFRYNLRPEASTLSTGFRAAVHFDDGVPGLVRYMDCAADDVRMGDVLTPAADGAAMFVFTDPVALLDYVWNGGHRLLSVVPAGACLSETAGMLQCTGPILVTGDVCRDVLVEATNHGDRNTGFGNHGSRNTGNCNEGDRNTGDNNAGDRNTGHRNTGCCNAGDCNFGSCNTDSMNVGGMNSGYGNVGSRNAGRGNTGRCNAGDGNEGDFNAGSFNKGTRLTGYFNTGEAPLMMFNKPVADGVKPEFPRFFEYVHATELVPYEELADKDKSDVPGCSVTGGMTRSISMRDAWSRALAKAKRAPGWREERRKLLALPNFDYAVFEEITGITKKMIGA